MRTLILIAIHCLTHSVYGQATKDAILQIDNIVKNIDSTKGLRQAITDGRITIKGKKKSKGSYSNWYYVDTTSKKLVKVYHERSLFYDDFQEYYFHNDSLILVITRRTETINSVESIVSSGRYYFFDNIVIHSQEHNINVAKPDAFLQNAKVFLDDRKTLFYPFE